MEFYFGQFLFEGLFWEGFRKPHKELLFRCFYGRIVYGGFILGRLVLDGFFGRGLVFGAHKMPLVFVLGGFIWEGLTFCIL